MRRMSSLNIIVFLRRMDLPKRISLTVVLAVAALTFYLTVSHASHVLVPAYQKELKTTGIQSGSTQNVGLFNCSKPSSNCSWFSPSRFPFHEFNLTPLCPHLRYPRYHTVRWWRKVEDQKRKLPFSHNLTYFKVLKGGSTSIALGLQQYKRTLQDLCRGDEECHAEEIARPLWEKPGMPESDFHLEALSSQVGDEDIIFTLIRDPIDRFLSATSQALLMPSNKNLRKRCLDVRHLLPTKPSRRKHDLLECMVDTIESAPSYGKVDSHLCPQAMQLRTDHTLKVSVFQVTSLFQVLEYLQKPAPALTSAGGSSNVHARDRSRLEYSHSGLLASLSIEDVSPQLRLRICRLYKIDVALFRALGMPTKCDRNKEE